MPTEPQLEQPIVRQKIKAGLAQRRHQREQKEESTMTTENPTPMVDRIKATVRYSQPRPDGSYKTLELGLEASLGPAVDWPEAQAQLYAHLVTQFLEAWEVKVIDELPQPAKEPNQEPDWTPEQEPGLSRQKPTGPYCQAHRTPFQRYEGEGQVWYSHRAPDGSWCRYREPNRGRR